MAQSNAAYDFERLEQHYAPSAPKVRQPPELRVVENRRAGVSFGRGAAAFLMVLTILCAVLYNRVMLTELTAQLEQTQGQLETLKAEHQRLELEMENKTSLRTVQMMAESLGMSKAEAYQIEYVDLGGGDRVVLARESEPGLLGRIRARCDAVMEYLGF